MCVVCVCECACVFVCMCVHVHACVGGCKCVGARVDMWMRVNVINVHLCNYTYIITSM